MKYKGVDIFNIDDFDKPKIIANDESYYSVYLLSKLNTEN